LNILFPLQFINGFLQSRGTVALGKNNSKYSDLAPLQRRSIKKVTYQFISSLCLTILSIGLEIGKSHRESKIWQLRQVPVGLDNFKVSEIKKHLNDSPYENLSDKE